MRSVSKLTVETQSSLTPFPAKAAGALGAAEDTADGCEIHFAPLERPWLKRHCLLVFTGESIHSRGFLGGAGFRPSTVGQVDRHPTDRPRC